MMNSFKANPVIVGTFNLYYINTTSHFEFKFNNLVFATSFLHHSIFQLYDF